MGSQLSTERSLMATTTTIVCADCGRDYETVRRNTKYCSLCRLLRDLLFVDRATTKCWICSEVFAPIERREKSCGSCCYKAAKNGVAECAFCHQEKPRVNAGIAVCHGCARDPELRGKLMNSLMKKVAT